MEIEDADWFSLENLPIIPSSLSISRVLIQEWIDTMSSMNVKIRQR
jgi:hypothetical protein